MQRKVPNEGKNVKKERRGLRCVIITSAIEVNGRLQSDDGLRVGGGVQLLHSLVETRHVSLVMLLMMQTHDLRADHRLQGVIVVWKIRQNLLLSHGCFQASPPYMEA